ncbi:MAG: hypothetical protein GNW80_03105 [Asgard group archaeon]|nr:hypothetical protein [Asgard group archaeon]
MLRELNDLEFISLAVGQPFNIAVMLKIKGCVEIKLLESTFNKLQKRHPLLQVRIFSDENDRPWFTSEGVGTIPVTEIKRTDDSQALLEFHRQLSTPFDLEREKLPLIRISAISSPEITEIIICASHTISDGFSLVFLFRDMIKYMVNPEEEIIPLDFPKKDVDIFTPKIRRMMPKTSFFAYIVYALLRFYYFLRYVFIGKRKPADINIKEDDLEIHFCKLTEDQTAELLKRCKKEKVSVHSAISTAFSQEYPIFGSPVNLRGRLNPQIGESFGFYSGVAVYKKKYRKSLNFWQNARRLQKRLKKGLRDRKLFLVQKLLSKRISLELLRKIGTYYIEIVTKKQPFSVDNLGLLDKHIQDIGLEKFPTIERFFGGTTNFLDTFIVLFYTLRSEMHFYFHYTKTKYSPEEIRSYAETVMKRLVDAIEK